MQKIVGDRLRPTDARDPHGVAAARASLELAYQMIDDLLAHRQWAAGDAFTMADCAAAPALHYANRVAPLGDRHRVTTAYLDRLMARPSVARVVRDAEPYAALFPT